jgi:error-prone DNA polymerase
MSLRYAELQVTTNFSFLRGASHAGELVEQATALGLAAIAITDRNTLAGVVRAHVAAKDTKDGGPLRLVIGARLDLEDAPSLLVYPKDRAAYGRLCRLLSLGQGRADKGKCILHLADAAEYAEGQIFIALPPDDWDWREVSLAVESSDASAQILRFDLTRSRTTGSPPPRGEGLGVGGSNNFVHHPTPGPSPSRGEESEKEGDGPVSSGDFTSPLRGRWREAPEGGAAKKAGQKHREPLEQSLQRMKAALGNAPLYLAASHTYRGDDRARIAALAELGERCGTPIVATNDVLYHDRERRKLQDVVTCIREKTTLREAGFRLEANAERHLKSPAEMTRLFKGFEAALTHTLDIVEVCTFSLDDLKYEYPDEPVPRGTTPQRHLENLAWEGAKKYFPNGIPDKVRETIKKELTLIAERKFAPYFLTVNDIVAYARSQDILCQGRGSAANSVVCYCLGITAVNPTEVDLLFERFISSAREEPPDIDVDFEHERREEVIQWIYKRYGRDRAGLAATVISYRSRSAVRDVGKVFGLSEDTISALAGMVWGTYGGSVPPEKHVRGAGLDPTDPTLKAAMELAQELMGFPRHLSQHVGGFVLTRGPLIEVVPVGNAAMEDRTFIEWDKDDIAALNLMKVDVLALGMLTCIRKAFELIEKHHGERYNLASVPRDNKETYDMLCRADSIGVFQVESRAQMNMLPRLKPRNLYDLVIEVAIVRPGPIQGDMVHPYLRRREGVEKEIYPSPAPDHGPPDELKEILGKTLGVPLFQEQAMRIAMDAAKFNDKEVSDLRRAMATFRRVGTIGQLEDKMISKMVERGYDRDFATRCFSQIKGFGDYGFPESHAASFALLVYVSAWIKCHHPAAFACALLNSQPMGFYAPAQIVRNAIENGVEVRDADVNFSDWDSTLECAREGKPALRLGLRLIDGLKEADIHEVPKGELKKKRRHRKATPPTVLIPPSSEAQKKRFRAIPDVAKRANVQVLEKIAAADAFRSLGLDRRQALWEVKALANASPLPLFAWSEARETGNETEVRLPEMRLLEHVVNDYQTLRLSLKAHPMSFLREDFRKARVSSCEDLRAMKDGARVQVAGVVLVRQRPGSGNAIFMTIEDETGIANAVIWPRTFERYRKVVMTARLIEIDGRLQKQAGEFADIIHIVSAKLTDRSDWLLRLSEWAADMKAPLANADEVLHPDPGSAHPNGADKRIHPRFSRPKPRHPRNVRIIPKSRDFH